MSESEDNDHYLFLQIFIIPYQTKLFDHHHYYRIGHHQNHYHQVQKCRLKFIKHFEPCLIYQNNEIFRGFVHCMIECEERAKVP